MQFIRNKGRKQAKFCMFNISGIVINQCIVFLCINVVLYLSVNHITLKIILFHFVLSYTEHTHHSNVQTQFLSTSYMLKDLKSKHHSCIVASPWFRSRKVIKCAVSNIDMICLYVSRGTFHTLVTADDW